MYSSNNKQYVFKQTSGKIWNFYRDEKSGLCYSILTKRNTWSEPVSIQKNFYKTFYMDMDYEDCFHVLFQDNQGNIFYTLIDGNNINTLPVLNSKSPSIYDKHLYLIPNKKAVHILFIIEYNNSTILSHQVLTAGTANTPKVIDYVVKSEHPYSAVCDKSGNFFVFYHVSDGKYLQLGFKKYIASQKVWSEFTPITRFNGDCEFPRALMDINDIIHIIYQRHTDRQYELIYQQKMPDRNMWTTETVIHSSQYAFTDSSIVITNSNIIVYWVRDDIIYFSASNDIGVSWSKPARYNFVSGRQLVNMNYKSNDPIESEKILAKDIPGSFINGFKLAFCHEASGTNNISPDELKNILLDGFKTLKGSIEELQDSNIALKENIASIDLAQQNLNRELAKYSIKLSILENELNKLKGIHNKFETLKSTIDEFQPSINSKLAEINKLKEELMSNAVNRAHDKTEVPEFNNYILEKPSQADYPEGKKIRAKKDTVYKKYKSKK